MQVPKCEYVGGSWDEVDAIHPLRIRLLLGYRRSKEIPGADRATSGATRTVTDRQVFSRRRTLIRIVLQVASAIQQPLKQRHLGTTDFGELIVAGLVRKFHSAAHEA